MKKKKQSKAETKIKNTSKKKIAAAVVLLTRSEKRSGAKEKEKETKNKKSVASKNPSARTKVKKNKPDFSSQKLLSEFFEEEKVFEKNFSRTLRRLKFWSDFFLRFKKISIACGKLFLRLSWRSGVAIALLAIIYFVSPLALSAPESVSVTLKSEWEQGTLTNVQTYGTTATEDAIQLQSTGTWNARVWEPAPDTIYVGHSSVIVGTDIYVFHGYSDTAFWKYDTVRNEWEVLDDAPFPAYYGADMAYDGAGNIFAIFGGQSKKAYEYNIENKNWIELPDLPDTVWSGGAIEADGSDIYVIRGNGSNDFWKYSATGDEHWPNMSAASCNVTTGGNLVNGKDGYLYLACGGRTNYNFYKYKLGAGEGAGLWSAETSLLTGYGLEGENKPVYADGYLYYMTYNYYPGTIQYFYLRYDLEGHTWAALDSPPSTVNMASLVYNVSDHLIYAFRSNGTFDLWKFNPALGTTGKWVGPEQVMDSTITLNTGSDLIWNGGSGASNFIYATQGNTANFYRYDVTSNDWAAKDPLPSSVGGRDMKGTYCNNAVYFLQGVAPYTAFYRYTEDDWETLDTQPFPAADSHGSALTCASDGTIYAIQGGATQNFYSYTPDGGWDTSLNKMIVGGVTYYAYQGARIAAKGTDIYVMLGDGETTFLKYHSGAWSKVAPTPFAQYYGTDMTYDSATQKIYALAGYYKNETWEYDPSNGALGTWRRLPNNQEYSYGRGPYSGASIEYAGGSSLYATTGQGFADMWSYSVGATNYPVGPATTGNYVSQVMDLSDVANWVSFTSHDSTPANTSVVYETRTGDTATPDANWSSWDTLHEGKPNSPKKRYFQVRITLSSTDGASTPTVFDYSVSFNRESADPTNPTTITGASAQIGGTPLVSGTENLYTYGHPYFNWPDPGTAGGAVDTGSGVDGYYVYFGTESGADPETEGSYITSTAYMVNEELTAGTYYLRIKTKDDNGNIQDSAWDAFTYSYNGISPPLSNEITDADDFNLGDMDNAEAVDSADSLRLKSASGFWNESRLSAATLSISNGGEFAYSECNGDHKCLYTFRGSSTNTFYEYDITADAWTQKSNAYNNELVAYGGSLVEGPEGYLYGAKGIATNQFWRYNIGDNTWEAMAIAPKTFTYGSVMAYDGNRYIYAMPGGDDVLMRFDTEANDGYGQWTTSPASANFGNPNASSGQFIGADADMVYDGRNNLYVTQGASYPYFAKYSIVADPEHGETANTWTPLATAPNSFVNGGSLGYDSENDVIYALRGGSRSDFYKYNVAANTWEEMPDTPASMGYGASLMMVDGTLYAQRGNGYNSLYKFNIEENSWEVPQRAFFGPSTFDGSNYFAYSFGTATTNDDDGNLYIIRGNYDNTFGKYETASGTFTELARLPMGAYNGASLDYVDDEQAIYYSPGDVRSTKSYFYKYDITTNVWSEFADPPGQIYRGSSMAYDGSRFLYLTQGNNGSVWWRYDSCRNLEEGETCTPGWSAALPTYAGWGQGYGSQIVYKGGIIYATRGENTNTFFACNTASLPGACWSSLASLPVGENIDRGGSLVDGSDGYLYAALGGVYPSGGTNKFYSYKISNPPGWEVASSVPAQVYNGGSAAYENNRIWLTAGAGTNSYSDGLFSYVIGSSVNGTGFEQNGTYTSDPINLTAVYQWANLETKYTLPDNTDVNVYTKTSPDGSNWSDWGQANNEHAYAGGVYRYNIVSTPAKYIQTKIEFTSSDRIFSPEMDYFKINYYQDIGAPENPTAVSAYNIQTGTEQTPKVPINSATWYKHATPYFEWPAVGAEGGASDNAGGSGVSGYYVYFGTEADGEPTSFQESNNYTASNLVSGQTYYLRIQAKDNANNIPEDIFPAFTYQFDGTAPTNPSDISVTPAGYTASDNFVFLWESNVSDAESGIKKFQYRTDGDETGQWYDINDPSAVTITIPNSEHITGAYQGGKNWFYLRAVDNALNESSAIAQEFYYSSTAPSPPENLKVDPEYSDSNSFSFSWDEPAAFAGESSKLKYYYSVNAKPTQFNITETPNRAVGPAPFATQKGTNTFYVVAKDESGNIDYSLYSSVEFTADTANPPVPVNVQAFDTSDRESQEYSVAVKWSTPEGIDTSNFAGYAIFRSEDNATFAEMAMTTGSAFVDTGLESKLYYYYVKAKDKTNNYSIASSTVSLTPTGRYTTAPKIVQQPSTTVQSYQATFSWATNRVCSSFVEYGKTIKLGETTGQVDSLTDHEVLVKGLEADTKYFYRVKFIDPDGNIGTSEVDSLTTLPPPTISEFAVSDVALNSAHIGFKTNAGAVCTIKYGIGAYTSTIEETASATSHMEMLDGLESSTTYNVMADCTDGDGNIFSSDEYTFTTLRQPVVSEPQVENKENVDIPTVDVSYKTDESTTTLIKFKSNDEGSYHNYLTNDSVTEHKATIEGLEPAKEYEMILSGISGTGVEALSQTIKVTTRSDSRPPEVIVNRAVGKVNGRGKDAQATVYIKIETNELTAVKINYSKGVTVSGFDQNTTEDAANTYHMITIPVEAGQVYSYQAEAYDMARNQTLAKPNTIVVEDNKANAAEIVTGTFSRQFGWLGTLFGKK
ncbi:MAG: hypothetical protein WC858_01120 [Parcubacteria group bacterium]|jgi:hypothetical protein